MRVGISFRECDIVSMIQTRVLSRDGGRVVVCRMRLKGRRRMRTRKSWQRSIGRE